MADNNGGGGNGLLGVVLGVVLVAIVALGFVAFNGGFGGGQSAEINVEAPEVPSPG